MLRTSGLGSDIYCIRKRTSAIVGQSAGEQAQYIDYILTVLEELNSKINKICSLRF